MHFFPAHWCSCAPPSSKPEWMSLHLSFFFATFPSRFFSFSAAYADVCCLECFAKAYRCSRVPFVHRRRWIPFQKLCFNAPPLMCSSCKARCTKARCLQKNKMEKVVRKRSACASIQILHRRRRWGLIESFECITKVVVRLHKLFYDKMLVYERTQSHDGYRVVRYTVHRGRGREGFDRGLCVCVCVWCKRIAI